MSAILQVDTSFPFDVSVGSVDCLDSSFFKVHGPSGSLPTPAQVRALLKPGSNKTQPPPVKFEELNLLVKFGPHVYVNEAQCLRMIRNTFGKRIPVPEVYGWRTDNRQVFIYMQLIRGHTLRERWDDLSTSDRIAICSDLRDILKALRGAKLPLPRPYIGKLSSTSSRISADCLLGSVLRGPVTDIIFEGLPEHDPFPDVKTFHDWISSLLWRGLPRPQQGLDPWRPYLPDEDPIILTHADLHRSNIMISLTNPPRVIAIIDWAHAGWYPAYWEYCKACYTAPYNEEWRVDWIPKILDISDDEFSVFSEYTHALGSV